MKRFVFISLVMLLSVAAVSAQQRFTAALDFRQETPPGQSLLARGTCGIVLNAAETQITVTCTYSGLTSPPTEVATRGPAVVGLTGPVIFNYTGLPAGRSGTIGPLTFAVTPTQVADMRAHRHYVRFDTQNLPNGEMRGQIKQATMSSDFDGDGRSDATIFRQSDNSFYTLNSLFVRTPVTVTNTPGLGTGTGDNYLNNSGDFDGDGRADPLLLKVTTGTNVANWNIYNSATFTVTTTQWGNFGATFNDALAMADYDGDGRTDIAVFRRATGVWYILESSTGNPRYVAFGAVNDFPSVGDYDGDGKADPTVVRVESGARVWYTLRSSDGQFTRTQFGLSATDGLFFFAPFDIDGDGKQDIMVNRPVGGQKVFFAQQSSNGNLWSTTWGLSTDTALFGDYDGDGKTDIVARRFVGTTLTWFVQKSSDFTPEYIYWGTTGDQ